MEKFKTFDLLESETEGTNLIEASAGTGKTYTITGLFIRFILEKNVPHEKILVVTFTEAATKELKERIRLRLKELLLALKIKLGLLSPSFTDDNSKDPFITGILAKFDAEESLARIEEAINAFDQTQIYTIHGFCRRVLLENAFESHTLFDAEIAKDLSPLLTRIADDFYKRNFTGVSTLFAGYAFTKNLTPDYLKNFLKASIAKPSLKIIPKVDLKNCDLAEKEFENLYQSLREIWLRNKDEIGRILLKNTSLNRSKYKVKTVGRLILKMDSFLHFNKLTASFFSGFEKFGTDYISKSVKKGFDCPVHIFFDICQDLIDKKEVLTDLYDENICYLKNTIIKEGKAEFDKIKTERNIIGFDDLLTGLKRALNSDHGENLVNSLNRKYSVALIDEFQDTDPVQYEIFRKIFFKKGSLFLIGDPKQAIYSFRGADIYSYIDAFRHSERRYTLGRNYRSRKNLVKAVNSVFEGVNCPFFYHWIDFKGALAFDESEDTDPLLNIWFLESDKHKKKYTDKELARKESARKMAGEIIRLVNEDNDIFEKDIAILVRTNREADQFKSLLEDFSIRSIVHSNSSVFDSTEALDLLRILKAILEPDNRSKIKTALSTEIMGYSLNEIAGIENDEKKWGKILSDFTDYNSTWKRFGFTRMIREFFSTQGTVSFIAGLTNGERRATNLLHLTEVLHKQDTIEKGPEKLAGWLEAMREEEADRDDESLLRLSGDENLVKIVTIHKSKGMEYPVVFCPSLYGESLIKGADSHFFFHGGDENQLYMDIGSDQKDKHLKEAVNESLAENLRLTYVALTRAKERCYIVWGKIGKYQTSPLSYLFHGKEGQDSTERVKNLSDMEMINDLKGLCERSKGTIGLSLIDETPFSNPSHNQKKEKPLGSADFNGKIDDSFGISSFSAIAPHGKNPEKKDVSYLYTDELKEEKGQDIFTFPKGSVPGLFMHEVLEDIDYTVKNVHEVKKLVQDKLEKYDFDESYCTIIVDMVKKLLNTDLDKRYSLKLSQIDNSKRINELEFYFPVKSLKPAKIESVLNMHNLNFSKIRGFLKGYIDLIVQHEDRFYIIDWKSNHLGDLPSDYAQDNLKTAMEDNFYGLQYHIYTVALHKYLKRNLENYSYNKNFGGVLYIFLRGIEENSSNGIFMDIPPLKTIEALESAFEGDKIEIR